MRPSLIIPLLMRLLPVAAWMLLGSLGTPLAAAVEPYLLGPAIPIGGPGRWDYVLCSPDGTRLYVPRSTHTQVIDIASGAVIADLPKTLNCHGVALVPRLHRGFISNGASVTIFDTTSNRVLGQIAAAADADCIITDPATQRVLVFCGDAHAVVGLPEDVDPVSGKADRILGLGGDPEFAAADGQGHVYVNLKDTSEVVVVNTLAMTIEHRFPLAPGMTPTGMSMDPANGRLFIGCRNKLLIIMDAHDGSVVAQYSIGAGVDATAFYHGLIYASCGNGTVTIVRQASANCYILAQVLNTQPGARTLAVNPRSGALYLPTCTVSDQPAAPGQRPAPVPDSFRILVALPTAP